MYIVRLYVKLRDYAKSNARLLYRVFLYECVKIQFPGQQIRVLVVQRDVHAKEDDGRCLAYHSI